MYISSVNQFFPLVYLIVLGPLMLFVCIYFSRKIETKYLKFDTNLITKLFGLSSLAIFILSSLLTIFTNNTFIDLQLHDIYYVIEHFHILTLLSLIMGIWTLTYYITPKLIKRNLNNTLSEIHFWTTLFGMEVFIILMQASAISTGPRRYYSFGNFDPYMEYGYINAAITIVAILLLTNQIIYFANLVYSVYKNPKIES